MYAILLGPPGAGKGTVARILTEDLHVTQISTGDILRSNIRDQTHLGKQAKTFMDAGNLVPDDLVIDMVKDYLSTNKFPHGFIFDGFPRTIDQAEALVPLLEQLNLNLDGVILIDISDDEIVRRITSRRTCSNADCQAIYNLNYVPPAVEGTCDKCGWMLMTRDDETEEVIRNRLKVYNRQTKPLVDYYREKGMLKSYNHEDSRIIADLIKADFAHPTKYVTLEE